MCMIILFRLAMLTTGCVVLHYFDQLTFKNLSMLLSVILLLDWPVKTIFKCCKHKQALEQKVYDYITEHPIENIEDNIKIISIEAKCNMINKKLDNIETKENELRKAVAEVLTLLRQHQWNDNDSYCSDGIDYKLP